jgi:predicted XRE-type DNA-binding protein
MVQKLLPLIWPALEVSCPVSATVQLETCVLLRRIQKGKLRLGAQLFPAYAIGPRCFALLVTEGVKLKKGRLFKRGMTGWRIIYRADADAILILDARPMTLAGYGFKVIRPSQRRMREYAKARKARSIPSDAWRVGESWDFAGARREAVEYMELRLGMCEAVRRLRRGRGMSQHKLAEELGSSQSRVAKLEAGDVFVSFDLLMRAMLVVGASRKDIARVILRPELSPEGRIRQPRFRVSMRSVMGGGSAPRPRVWA